MSIIKLSDVSYSYNTPYQTVDAIKNVSYEFNKGKVYALIGKSGSGKTTLLSLLAGLDLPDSGQVLFKDTPTSQMNLDRYRRESAAVIYQNFCLFPMLTVMENIIYPMELRRIPKNKGIQMAKKYADKVSLPNSLLNRFPGMISGGEQQRVAIARALSMDTQLILADEPTGNLDRANGDNIIDILLKLAHEDNYCIIIATHDMELVSKVDEVIYIGNGGIINDQQSKRT